MLGKTIDLGYVLEIHSQITDAERYRLLTSEGPRKVLLDTIRQNRCEFLKSWLQDDRFSNWLVYTQLSRGGSFQRWALPQIGPQIADSSFYLRICEPNFRPQIFADLR